MHQSSHWRVRRFRSAAGGVAFLVLALVGLAMLLYVQREWVKISPLTPLLNAREWGDTNAAIESRIADYASVMNATSDPGGASELNAWVRRSLDPTAEPSLRHFAITLLSKNTFMLREFQSRLVELLNDNDPRIRRLAIVTIDYSMDKGITVPPELNADLERGVIAGLRDRGTITVSSSAIFLAAKLTPILPALRKELEELRRTTPRSYDAEFIDIALRMSEIQRNKEAEKK